MTKTIYDAIIIGGSYSGLSAAMSLGRALRNVLVIDEGKPCNSQTPHSHNFLTQDGVPPLQIATIAMEQVRQYPTVNFYKGRAVQGKKKVEYFEITTQDGNTFTARRLLFATGLKDHFPDIKAFAECWGISVLHCPYCHGYEVKQLPTGIIANGDIAFHYAQLIYNWTKELTIYTNGKSTLSEEQQRLIKSNSIAIIEKEIDYLDQEQGKVSRIVFKDTTDMPLEVLYSRPDWTQHCSIPEELGCELTEMGLLKVDATFKTTVEGIYASGDCSGMRTVSVAVSSGTQAGAFINNELAAIDFVKM
ncbi:NAD(P)/FAD-dependent oxidoreductase [Flavobacterium cerinum]|uniref:NAD(P)/FAD-dependent oxidoreductase n=1 Tax=Flavobacterium cerinum TaxID=2502784 RepID=A0ABY5ITY2_9FLAO|nr:NAD(P)/FAD-dependent oxidoreductase [Flavobacterium cerinum]UUC45213.1 NAD(P)/FAD-dependent oxidoreductase [Flavobacterium cerinum]